MKQNQGFKLVVLALTIFPHLPLTCILKKNMDGAENVYENLEESVD